MTPDEAMTRLLRATCEWALARLTVRAFFALPRPRRWLWRPLHRLVLAVGLANEAVADLRLFLADFNSTARWWWARRTARLTRPRDSGAGSPSRDAGRAR